MDNCIFCKIIKKEIPSKMVFEDENVFAFYDITPQAPVHILVIPKEHIGSITKVEAKHKEIMFAMIEAINKITEKLNLHETGFRLIVNHGKDAGQAVPHLHFHILGGRGFSWPPG